MITASPLLDKDSKQHLPHSSRPFLSSCNPIRKQDGLSSGEMMAKLSFHTLKSSAEDGHVPLGTVETSLGLNAAFLKCPLSHCSHAEVCWDFKVMGEKGLGRG